MLDGYPLWPLAGGLGNRWELSPAGCSSGLNFLDRTSRGGGGKSSWLGLSRKEGGLGNSAGLGSLLTGGGGGGRSLFEWVFLGSVGGPFAL